MRTSSGPRRAVGAALVGGVVAAAGVVAMAAGPAGSAPAPVAQPAVGYGWGYDASGAAGGGSTDGSTARAPGPIAGLAGTPRQVAAGTWFSAVLMSDGTVATWGLNGFGSGVFGDGSPDGTERALPAPVPGLAGITQIDVGDSHVLAIGSGGVVRAWGANTGGQLGDGTTTTRPTPVQVRTLSHVVQVGAGSAHSLALRSDGTVWAWGSNQFGQLGDGTTTNRTSPVRVSGLTRVVAISAGFYHNLALRSDGTVWAWGENDSGQVGQGTAGTPQLTPVQVPGLSGVTEVSAGSYFSLAVAGPNATLWGWGSNATGDLGDGTNSDRHSPEQLPMTGVVQVAGSEGHTAAIRSDGTLWTWGDNNTGQLGYPTSDTFLNPTPTMVPGLTGVTQVTVGIQHMLALLAPPAHGWGWGYDGSAAAGSGSAGGPTVRLPGVVAGLPGTVRQVAPGADVSAAVLSNGTVSTWGENRSGALGDGSANGAVRPLPATVPGLAGITQLDVGDAHVLAVGPGGRVWAWGANSSGQLGDGTATDRFLPVQVRNLFQVVQVSAGQTHSLALRSDGTVWAWGSNAFGQLGDGTTTNRTSPVQVSGLTDVVAISAGFYHNLALRSDGTVWAWGQDGSGQLGQGAANTPQLTPVQVPGLSGVTQVAAGSFFSLAVAGTDSSLWTWGGNSLGELGDGSTTDRRTPQHLTFAGVVQVAGAEGQTAAVRSDGTVWTWGGNNTGQLGLNRSDPFIPLPTRVPGLSGVRQVAVGIQHMLAVTVP